ncbi:hypothetical protein ACEUBT_15530 [Aeromonas bivalvium]
MQTHRRIASILLLICGGLSMPAVASSLTVLTSFSESPIKAMVEGFRQRHPEVRLEVIYRRTLSAQRLLT